MKRNLNRRPQTTPDLTGHRCVTYHPFGNATHTALAFSVLGEDVLITGAGPIGLMATAIVKHAGARYIVTTDVNPYRLKLAKKMGATVALNIREKKITDIQNELGMKEGFDVGLEMSGNGDAFQDMIANMCHGGKIAILGIPTQELAVDWDTVIFNMLTLIPDRCLDSISILQNLLLC